MLNNPLKTASAPVLVLAMILSCFAFAGCGLNPGPAPPAYTLHPALPAPAQGAIAIECRAGDDTVAALCASLDDAATRACVGAERAMNMTQFLKNLSIAGGLVLLAVTGGGRYAVAGRPR